MVARKEVGYTFFDNTRCVCDCRRPPLLLRQLTRVAVAATVEAAATITTIASITTATAAATTATTSTAAAAATAATCRCYATDAGAEIQIL